MSPLVALKSLENATRGAPRADMFRCPHTAEMTLGKVSKAFQDRFDPKERTFLVGPDCHAAERRPLLHGMNTLQTIIDRVLPVKVRLPRRKARSRSATPC